MKDTASRKETSATRAEATREAFRRVKGRVPSSEKAGLSQVSEIVGQWVEAEDGIRRDESAKLIRQLTASEGGRFHELATAEAGWSTLYRDPADGRLWEKTFPQSELHGGGPPRLNVLSEEEARDKYGSGVFAPTAP